MQTLLLQTELIRRQKISIAMRGRKITWKEKISSAKKKGHYNYCLVDNTPIWVQPYQEKIGEGKYCSPQCSGVAKIGRKVSEETKKKQSIALKNYIKTHPDFPLFQKGTGRYLHHRGYMYRYIGNGKSQYEHRYVMEQYLKRKLSNNEVIHHKNGNRVDNRIENLVLMTKVEHDNYPHRKRNSSLKGGCFK